MTWAEALTQLQAAADKRRDRSLRALARALEDFERDIIMAVGKKAEWRYDSLKMLLGDIEAALERSGLPELSQTFGAAGREFAEIANRLPGVSFSKEDASLLRSAMGAKFEKWDLSVNLSAINKAKELLIGQTVSAIPAEDLADILKGHLRDDLQKYAGTYIETGLQTQLRETTIQAGVTSGVEWWEYYGPDDEVTRKFCKELLDEAEIYTLDEIGELDNGQDLPVLSNGGGWNCRHGWRPASADRIEGRTNAA